MNSFSRQNNFDLLRLVAALQVVVSHSLTHLQINAVPPVIVNYIKSFPGVLMFFAISGFLISSSLDRSKNFRKYAYNRVLRIFPALYCCFFVTLLLLFSFSVIKTADLFNDTTILKWIVTQLTFFQFWTPDILRSWGVGIPNGSLWTIPVELQFYVFLPLMVFFLKRIPIWLSILIFSVLSISLNFYLSLHLSVETNESISVKLISFSLLPYLYAFLIGSGLYYYWDKVRFAIEGKALYWFILFNILVLAFGVTPSYWPGGIQFLSNIVLSVLTISLAFTFTSVGKVLHGHDISYGVYIYHMLVVNSFVEFQLMGKLSYLFAVIFITICLQ